jgi:hypothetical protein
MADIVLSSPDMAERGKSGRTTPKGTTVSRTGGRPVVRPATPDGSGRYTPPAFQPRKVSPVWVPILMFTLFGLGALSIVLNYIGILPGAPTSWYLVGGLGLVTGGFVTATNLH